MATTTHGPYVTRGERSERPGHMAKRGVIDKRTGAIVIDDWLWDAATAERVARVMNTAWREGFEAARGCGSVTTWRRGEDRPDRE